MEQIRYCTFNITVTVREAGPAVAFTRIGKVPAGVPVLPLPPPDPHPATPTITQLSASSASVIRNRILIRSACRTRWANHTVSAKSASHISVSG